MARYCCKGSVYLNSHAKMCIFFLKTDLVIVHLKCTFACFFIILCYFLRFTGHLEKKCDALCKLILMYGDMLLCIKPDALSGTEHLLANQM